MRQESPLFAWAFMALALAAAVYAAWLLMTVGVTPESVFQVGVVAFILYEGFVPDPEVA